MNRLEIFDNCRSAADVWIKGKDVRDRRRAWFKRAVETIERIENSQLDMAGRLERLETIQSRIARQMVTMESLQVAVAQKVETVMESAAARIIESAQTVIDSAQSIIKFKANKKLRIAEIQLAVAQYFKISRNDLLSSRRARDVVRPRQIAMYLAKTLTPHSYPEIGRRFQRDHTTVLHAVRKIAARIETDPALADDIAAIKEELGVANRP